MKNISNKFNDISESGQFLQEKHSKYITIILCILLTILALLIVMSIYSEKNITIKATGVIEINNTNGVINNKTSGIVDEIYFSDSDKVEVGQTLYKLKNEGLVEENKYYEEKYNYYKTEIDNNKKLIESIESNLDLFDKTDPNQLEYSKKYNLFIDAYILKNSQATNLDDRINNLNKLFKSIEEKVNYNEKGSSYYYKYLQYVNELDTINNTFDNKEEQSDNNSKEKQRENIKYKYLSSIKDEIDGLENQGSNYKNDATSYKQNTILEIETTIKNLEANKDEINYKLEDLKKKIEGLVVKSEESGVISKVIDIKLGDYVQEVVKIAEIRDGNGNANVKIYINSNDIINIKEGQRIYTKINTNSNIDNLRYNGEIIRISTNPVSNENNNIGYLAEATLENIDDDTVNLKNGVVCDVSIITKKISYFKYILEKLNIF
jgi:membrane fusion protein, peptide pheromone/bacteriocin exporter